MTYRLFIITLITCLSAHADNLFVRGGMSVYDIERSKITATLLNLTTTASLEFDTAVSPEIAIGYYLEEGLALELALSQFDFDGKIDNADRFDVELLNIMLNAKLTFSIASAIEPYVALGLGIQDFDYKDDDLSIDKSVFMGSFSIGAEFPIDENLKLYSHYQITSTDNFSKTIPFQNLSVETDVEIENGSLFQVGIIADF